MPWYLALLVLLAGTGLAAQEEPAPDSDRSRQAAQEIQADVLVDAVLDELREQLVEERRMLLQILEEPGRHRRRDDSRAALLGWARGELDTFYERRLREIHERLNRGQDREVIRLDWLFGRADVRRPGGREAAKVEALASFDRVFQQARNGAVTRQWIELEPWVARFAPDAPDIERIAEGGGDLAPIRQRLAAHLANAEGVTWKDAKGGLVLLEENQERMDRALGDRVRRGLAELEEQRQILARGDVRGAFAETLERNLRQEIAERQRRSGGSAFGIFPSVAAALPRRAVELMEQRLAGAVGRAAVCRVLTEDLLRGWIVADLPRHREPRESARLLQQEASGRIGGDLARRHLEEQAEPADQAPRLLQRLGEERFAKALAGGVSSCLPYPLQRARNAVAEEQVRQRFPDLQDRALSEDAILAFRNDPDMTPEELARGAGVDLGPARGELLAEAVESIAASARSLHLEGSNALNQQLGFVEEVRPQIERSRAAGSPRETIVQDARSRVLESWKGRSRRSRTYASLFRETERRIEEIVDASFERPIKIPSPAPIVGSPNPREEARPRPEVPEPRPIPPVEPPPAHRPPLPRQTREQVDAPLLDRFDRLRQALAEKEDSLPQGLRQAIAALIEQLANLLGGQGTGLSGTGTAAAGNLQGGLTGDQEKYASGLLDQLGGFLGLGEKEGFGPGQGGGKGPGAQGPGEDGGGARGSGSGDGDGDGGGGGNGRGGGGEGGSGAGGSGGGGSGDCQELKAQIEELKRQLQSRQLAIRSPA